VTYVFTVTHAAGSDGSPVGGITVTDDVITETIDLRSGDDGDGLLEGLENWVYTASYTIQRDDDDPLENTANVSGTDRENQDVSADSNTHSLDIEFAPALRVVKRKSGPLPPSAVVSETVTFLFSVTNDDQEGDGSPISNVSVTDDVAGPATLFSGGGLLETGEIWVFTVDYQLQASDLNPLVNTATATGTDRDGHQIADTDTHTTTLSGFKPFLKIDTDWPATTYISQTITYTFILSHDPASDGSAVSSVVVSDTLVDLITRAGGDDGDDLLEGGESWFYTASYTILETDPDPITNTLTVSAQDQDPDLITVTTVYSAEVELFGPDASRVYLPVILAGHSGADPAPDLIVESITVFSDDVQVVIKNRGSASVTDSFWVDLYVNPVPVPTGVNQLWPDSSDYGIVWLVAGAALGVGESFTLSYDDPYYREDLSDISWPIEEGIPIYVQVDSADDATTYGAVLESHEISGGPYNNISHVVSPVPGAAGAEPGAAEAPISGVDRPPVPVDAIPARP
jgi:hypothetical protein